LENNGGKALKIYKNSIPDYSALISFNFILEIFLVIFAGEGSSDLKQEKIKVYV
jgi:hypothetical protein